MISRGVNKKRKLGEVKKRSITEKVFILSSIL